MVKRLANLYYYGVSFLFQITVRDSRGLYFHSALPVFLRGEHSLLGRSYRFSAFCRKFCVCLFRLRHVSGDPGACPPRKHHNGECVYANVSDDWHGLRANCHLAAFRQRCFGNNVEILEFFLFQISDDFSVLFRTGTVLPDSAVLSAERRAEA